MYILSKKHWDLFIYRLLYPGFVGSIIYELIDISQGANSASSYLIIETRVKIIITICYCLDYMHLFGDMHEIFERRKRSWIYLVCDIASSLLFFFAFVFVKLKDYDKALLCLAVVPICFLLYKIKNWGDLVFHSIFLIGSIIWSYNIYHKSVNDVHLLYNYSMGPICVYAFYVFVYYELVSKKIDKNIYNSNKNQQ